MSGSTSHFEQRGVRTDSFAFWEAALGLSSRVARASPIRHNDILWPRCTGC